MTWEPPLQLLSILFISSPNLSHFYSNFLLYPFDQQTYIMHFFVGLCCGCGWGLFCFLVEAWLVQSYFKIVFQSSKPIWKGIKIWGHTVITYNIVIFYMYQYFSYNMTSFKLLLLFSLSFPHSFYWFNFPHPFQKSMSSIFLPKFV